MPKQVEYKVTVTIKADPKSENRFFQKLAERMVEEIMGKPKTRIRKPKIKLEKPLAVRKPRKKSKKGQTIYPSKDLDFSKEEVRRRETRKLIRRMAKEKGITTREMAVQMRHQDFRKNGIGLVMGHHDNSPYRAVVEVYPRWNLMPWEMKNGVMHVWKSKENRVAALNFALKKSQIRPEEIRTPHFKEAGLKRLLNRHKIYSLLVDAGYAYSLKETRAHARSGQFSDEKLYPWQLISAPFGFYKKPINRKNATKWMVHTHFDDPKEIIARDFSECGLRGLLIYYPERNGGVKKALREAGFKV